MVVNDPGGSGAGEGNSTSAADRVVQQIRGAGGEAVANHDSLATRADGGDRPQCGEGVRQGGQLPRDRQPGRFSVHGPLLEGDDDHVIIAADPADSASRMRGTRESRSVVDEADAIV